MQLNFFLFFVPLPSPLSLFQADSSPLVSCPNISALITPRISLLEITTFLELITLHVSLYTKKLNLFFKKSKKEEKKNESNKN